MTDPSILRTAHGKAAESGALLVAETPVLAELRPLSAEVAEAGAALRKSRGRPFQVGNAMGKLRKPSLASLGTAGVSDVEERRARRRAVSLRRHRMRELSILHGGEVSSGVAVELTSWALATAYSRLAYDRSDPTKGAALAEKASGHHLKAIAIAEREAVARAALMPTNPHAALALALAEPTDAKGGA